MGNEDEPVPQPINPDTHPIVTGLIDTATYGNSDDQVRAIEELVALGFAPADVFLYEEDEGE